MAPDGDTVHFSSCIPSLCRNSIYLPEDGRPVLFEFPAFVQDIARTVGVKSAAVTLAPAARSVPVTLRRPAS